ncbi:hypothetical protein C8Z91_08430 [Paenibacillus elgii]|uniref:Uncharacterized protein n=1 Tax=Paenibacillus elgii TaxID=189691 RepID=A0A2T6G5K6_9BACL|nr:hypothetical protein [Paenibacillus elgii]PUA39444.1 hypothetical protein C8Z91_08430 [Paenibacillus elgii]
MRKTKLIMVSAALILVAYLCVQELPVKHAVSAEFDYTPKGELSLGEIEIISEHSDGSGADWKILGYNNHLFPSANGYMYVEGANPMDELSEFLTIYDQGSSGGKKNRFILKGVLEKREGPRYNEQDGNLVLVSKGWEILYPIRGRDVFRPLASTSYLSKWDYKDPSR